MEIFWVFLGGILILTILFLLIYMVRQREMGSVHDLWFQSIPDPVILLDQNNRVLSINQAGLQLSGLPLENVIDHPSAELLSGKLKQFEHFWREGRKAFRTEVEVSKGVSWYHLTALPLKADDNHHTHTLIVLHDITAYKRLESALEASQDLYRNVTEHADDGIVIVQDGLIVYLNPRILAMTGYLPGDLLYRSFESFILQEHVQAVRDRYHQRLIGEVPSGNIETQLIKQDGTSMPVEIKIGTMSYEGKPAALTMIQDISYRKQTEDQLRLQSEALRSAANSIVITDPKGTIQWVNPAFESLTGYQLEEIIGRHTRLLKSGLQDNAFYQRLWKTIKGGNVWRGELINRRKDGNLYDEHMTIAPVKDEKGVISHFVAIKENVSERKQAEIFLRKSEQQFKELVLSTPIPMLICQDDGRLLLMNWKFTEVFGYTPEDIQTVNDWWDKVFPDETIRQQFEAEWIVITESLTDSSGSKPVETQVLNKDGTLRLVSFSFVLLGDKYIIALADKTKQKRAENHLRKQVRFMMLLNEITRSALEIVKLDKLCQVLADRLAELFEAEGCYIVFWDEMNRKVVPMAAYGPMRETYRETIQTKPGEPTLTEAVLSKGRVLAVEDVFNSPYISTRIASLFPTRSMLVLPLIADQRKLGAALISYENPHTFEPEELLRGEQVAAQVALAISKTKLFEAESEKHQLSLALVEISTLLSVSINPEALLRRMLDLIQRVVPYDAGHIFIIDEGKTRVLFTQGYDQFGAELDEFVQQLVLEVDTTPNLREMMETCRPLIISDTAQDPNWINKFENPTLFRSWAGAPIHYEGRVLAMFSIEKRQPNSFRPEHAGRLAAFAGQAALVLEYARIYEEVHQLAILDSLTGAFTRRQILENLLREVERSHRYHLSMCIGLLDIDHFKKINDTYGHQIGDIVLQKVIVICQNDLRKTDMIGRYGGEEFLIMLPQTDLDYAFLIAERLRSQIEKIQVETEKGNIHTTVSIGVAKLVIDQQKTTDENLNSLIQQADQTLYLAKQAGRNKVIRYKPG